MKGRVIVIGGPTATGKTALSVAVAKALGGEIVSADSMQFYRGLDIGTAKVTESEKQGVPHYMLDFVAPTESYSVAAYQQDACACIDDILSRGRVPIVVGGTGLYINAVLFPMEFRAYNSEIRAQIAAEYEQFGNQAMYEKLASVAPEMASKLYPNDVKRVSRSLELVAEGTSHSTGDNAREARYEYKMFVLSGDRAALYARIDKRVDVMLEHGLTDEVRALLDSGVPRDAQSFQAIAYKELAAYMAGEIDYEAAVELIKKRSRNYAKRQLTWFRQYKDAIWLDYADVTNASRIIKEYEEWK